MSEKARFLYKVVKLSENYGRKTETPRVRIFNTSSDNILLAFAHCKNNRNSGADNGSCKNKYKSD